MDYKAIVLAAAAFGVAALPQLAHADQASDARVRALKANLAALQKRYAQQEQRIDRLEREFATLHEQTVVARIPGGTPISLQPVAVPSAKPSEVATTTNPSTGGPLGGVAPKTQSTKNVYQQENAFFTHGLTLTPGVQYSYGDSRLFTINGFLALGTIFLGNIDVTRQQNTIVEPSITADYSGSSHSQWEVTVPWVDRYSLYDAQGAQNSTELTSQQAISSAQVGDVSVAYYYQVPNHRSANHQVVLNAHVSVPTGSSPYGIKICQNTANANLSYPNRLPTGSGVYTGSVGATMVQTLDPAILFGGINVYGNLTRHVDDLSTAPTLVQPGRVAAGDAIVVSLGSAFALNDKVSTSFSLQDTIVQPTRVFPDGSTGWQTVLGSGLNAAVFNVGTTVSTSTKSYWQAVLGIGMTQDAPNFQLNFRFPQSP